MTVPTQKHLLQLSTFFIVVLALLLGYYANNYQVLSQAYEKKDRDYKRLERYIGTDKALEILKKE